MRKHGKYKEKIYSTWEGMIQRCTNEKNDEYRNYGMRGITVCDAWRDFEVFYADMGDPQNGVTLDRIDNDKGYSKENCRWATGRQQAFNKRIRSDNKTGVPGVQLWGDKFRAVLCGKHIGLFDTLEEAKEVIDARRMELIL